MEESKKQVFAVYKVKIGDPDRTKQLISVHEKEWVAVEIADMLQEHQEIWGPVEWVYSLQVEEKE